MPNSDQLPPAIKDKLLPIATFRAPDTTNLVDLEYQMDPTRPYEVLPVTDAFADITTIEVLDPKLLAVKQIGEDGEPQVVVLTPSQLALLMCRAGSFMYFPNGVPAFEKR